MNADTPNKELLESPLISTYLGSLERALTRSEDREEVVASVREHILDALSAKTNPKDPQTIRDVLTELGPVERIANISETAMPEAVHASVPGSWGAVVSAVVAVFSLFAVFLVPIVAIPFAFASLVAGVVMLRSPGTRNGAAVWLTVIISGATLLLSLIGALFFLPYGDPAPQPVRTGIPSGEAIPANP